MTLVLCVHRWVAVEIVSQLVAGLVACMLEH